MWIYLGVFVLTGLVGVIFYTLLAVENIPIKLQNNNDLLKSCIVGSFIGLTWVIITKIISSFFY
jgi:hypothetical protein